MNHVAVNIRKRLTRGWAEWARENKEHYEDEANEAKNKMVKYSAKCMENLLLVKSTTIHNKVIVKPRAGWSTVEAAYAAYAASRVVWVLWASTCALWCAAGGWSARSRGSVRQGWAAKRRARTRTKKGEILRTREDQWTYCGTPPGVTTAGNARLCDLPSSCIRSRSHFYSSNRKASDLNRMCCDMFCNVTI